MPPEEEQDDGSPSSFDEGGDMIDYPDPNHNQPTGMTISSHGNLPESTPMNAKDPLRPRRKKARRACFACQRAHLTCGDERPCQRCVKRGIQDVCQDGVRKKAKYLHDAPESALTSGLPGGGHRLTQSRHTSSLSGSNSSEATVAGQQQAFLPSSIPNGPYGMGHQRPMPPPGQEVPHFANRQSPTSMYSGPGGQPPMPVMGPMTQVSPITQGGPPNAYMSGGFDPNDPAVFNFDLASLNFGNHYGALELGMLGHLSSGVAETPPADMGQVAPDYAGVPPGSAPFSQAGGNFVYAQGGLMDWQAHHGSRQGSFSNMYAKAGDMAGRTHPHAFAIGAGGTPYTSPSSGSSPQQNILPGYESSPMSSTFYANSQQPTPQQPHSSLPPKALSRASNPKNVISHGGPVKRPRQGCNVYETVKQPYNYTSAFHGLTAFLQRRFSPQKTLRIAKSLASIRPSFISCTKDLNRSDLIFMEKCFQRTLWEYENFINACGTPTIVCRRTGEVAAVGEGFSLLTGWKKEVLLGKEPNLNVNTGGGSGGPSRAGGFNQSRISDGSGSDDGSLRPQPIFLAELLDDDSVIQFYDDFAKLAFGDSRGSITTRCKLLTYRSRDEPAIPMDANGVLDVKSEVNEDEKWGRHPVQKRLSIKGSGIQGESGMASLGAKHSKVECSYCWTVKRDVFDIPMLIVMNFLPCI
ncbi:MAG: Transcriptional regulator of nonfermentable carbon utilization [Vezdaea aestivalis]|nr:MAG: Transcriptional regulator of nonfermentable carbon utilization [Vezdaea aestivalis]